MTFCDWLTLLFIALKLCGVIDWGWVLVLSPEWGAFLVKVLINLWKD